MRETLSPKNHKAVAEMHELEDLVAHKEEKMSRE